MTYNSDSSFNQHVFGKQTSTLERRHQFRTNAGVIAGRRRSPSRDCRSRWIGRRVGGCYWAVAAARPTLISFRCNKAVTSEGRTGDNQLHCLLLAERNQPLCLQVSSLTLTIILCTRRIMVLENSNARKANVLDVHT